MRASWVRSIQLVTLCVVAAVASACGVRPDAAPRDIDDTDRLLSVAADSTADQASGSGLVYLVAPGETRLLRSVRRDAASQLDLLNSLVAGPSSDESADLLTTALPADLKVLSTRNVGSVAYIDLSPEISELTGEALLLGVAQLVLTATAVDGVETVQLTSAGERFPWPVEDGATTSGLLRVFDFAGLFESAQPDYPALPQPA